MVSIWQTPSTVLLQKGPCLLRNFEPFTADLMFVVKVLKIDLPFSNVCVSMGSKTLIMRPVSVFAALRLVGAFLDLL